MPTLAPKSSLVPLTGKNCLLLRIQSLLCVRPAGIDKHSCNNAPKGSFDYMGYSVRTEDWRYTAWLDWDGEQ